VNLVLRAESAPRCTGGHGVGSGVPILVVLAEDHDAMRRSLRRLLDGEDGIRVVAEANDIASAAEHVRHHRPHVLVLEISLTSREHSDGLRQSGLELTVYVRANSPETQVVLITMQEHGGFARRALEAGAAGFVRKDLAEVELPDAVRAAARGERYTSGHFSGI